MKLWHPAVLIFLLLSNLLGCTNTLPPQDAQYATNNAINSIELAQHANASTVALIYMYHDGSLGALCSGVWVSHDVILTAAHCVTGFTKKYNQETKDLSTKKRKEQPLYLTPPDLSPLQMDIPYIVPKEAPLVDTAPTAPVHHTSVFYYAPTQDLALLRANDKIPPHFIVTLPASLPRMGQHLNLIGHPDGLYWSYMEGLVSAIRLQIPQDGPTPKNHDQVVINGPLIQFQAPITHGDSGGGIFDMQGHLLGIISFMDNDAPGSGFAIHTITIRQVLQAQHIIPSPIILHLPQ
jgi:hypothetical protein